MTPKIYVVKVNSPIDENTFQFLLKFVQQDKKERILKQRKKQNADNMLIADVLTKIAINNVFEIPLQEQNFAYSNHGKPYLSGFSDVHFNISHSGSYVACGLADKPIGIDIQKIGTYKPDLAKKVCNEAELTQIETSFDNASEFTKIWTQKEAVLKMQGLGIANGNIKNCLQSLDVESQKLDNYWISVWCP